LPAILLEKAILRAYGRRQDGIMANRIVKYNPAFLSDAELRESFVVRHDDLRKIAGMIGNGVTGNRRHVLVVGSRGSGKTTLVRRVALEIEGDEALSGRWYPLVLSEENYEIATAGEFWLEVLFHLAIRTGDSRRRRRYDRLKGEDDGWLAEQAFAELCRFADGMGKKILLVVENIDVLFGEAMEADAVRKVLQTLAAEPRLMLLATAVGPLAAISGGPAVLLGVFAVHDLRPLDDEACRLVWEAVAGKRPPGEEIRPVRILTGGNVRLVVVLACLGAKRPFGDLLDNLLELIDDHTEFFQGRLDRLPPIERKVCLALAELWESAAARDVARTARFDVNRTSALLNRLVGRGAVLVEMQKDKTKRYTMAERMVNIYCLLRRSGGPTDRVKAFVAFMVAMYGAGPAEEETGQALSEPCRDFGLACAEALEALPDCRVPDAVAPFAARLSAEAACIGETPEDAGRRSTKKSPQEVLGEKEKGEREAALAAAGQCVGLLLDGRYAEAGEECNEAMKRLASSSGVRAIALAALAMLGEGIALKGMNRAEDAIRVFDQIKALYGDYTEPEIAVLVVRAMIDKGLILAESGRPGEAMAVYDEAIAAYRDRPEMPLAAQAARAMVCEGRTFGCLERDADAEMAFRQAVELYPAGADGGILLVRLLLKNPGRAEEARGMAEAAAGRNSDNPRLLDALADAFYKSGEPSLLPQGEAWARRAVALDPGDPGKRITLACVLAALGKGDEALALAEAYLKDEAFVAVTIGRAIELFVELAAAGYAGEAVGLLANAAAARHLEPLVVGLRLFAGEDVKTAVEIREVAADVVKRIEARQAVRRLPYRPVP